MRKFRPAQITRYIKISKTFYTDNLDADAVVAFCRDIDETAFEDRRENARSDLFVYYMNQFRMLKVFGQCTQNAAEKIAKTARYYGALKE